ncbi:MAG TPA: hypothetical protein VHB51_03745 [Candidatus Saccharimonadales bacterium]|nr:hypothetical protein [Candidatus Saccharimonadales bacterium]
MSFDSVVRNTQRYGGREAVGSALWLEHCQGLVVPADSADAIITPGDLRADEKDFATNGYVQPHKLDRKVLKGLASTQLLRNYLLPALPVRMTGDSRMEELLLSTEVITHNIPVELTDSVGTTVISSDRPDIVPTFSIRFVPTVGEIESFGIYPASSHDAYAINAVEVDDKSYRAVIGGRVLIECFKVPQDEELPPQIAPHQF